MCVTANSKLKHRRGRGRGQDLPKASPGEAPTNQRSRIHSLPAPGKPRRACPRAAERGSCGGAGALSAHSAAPRQHSRPPEKCQNGRQTNEVGFIPSPRPESPAAPAPGPQNVDPVVAQEPFPPTARRPGRILGQGETGVGDFGTLPCRAVPRPATDPPNTLASRSIRLLRLPWPAAAGPPRPAAPVGGAGRAKNGRFLSV